jgi:hypothetical protein
MKGYLLDTSRSEAAQRTAEVTGILYPPRYSATNVDYQ